MKSLLTTILLVISLTTPVYATQLVNTRLFDVIDTDTTLKTSVESLMKEANAEYDVLLSGPQSPSDLIRIEGKMYAVFNTCEAHNCADNAAYIFVNISNATAESMIHVKGCSFTQTGLQSQLMQKYVENVLGVESLNSCSLQ